ncbi:hypothetical protein N9Y63_08510, partial [Akkermansiaceae bacterium]|nr:hypothetical protein [Akkermansiaceae bacterium]
GALLLVSHASAARVDGDEGPHVLGHGVGLFTAGEVIAELGGPKGGSFGGSSGQDWREGS